MSVGKLICLVLRFKCFQRFGLALAGCYFCWFESGLGYNLKWFQFKLFCCLKKDVKGLGQQCARNGFSRDKRLKGDKESYIKTPDKKLR